MKKRQFFAFFVFAVVVAVLANGDNSNDWANDVTVEGDRLICLETVDGDSFYVARNGSRVKTGYLLDVTGEHGRPKTILVSWKFSNQLNISIGRDIPPEVVRQGYRRVGKKIFAEEIAYRELLLVESTRLKVEISFNKYDEAADSPSSVEEMDRDLEIAVRCAETAD